MGTRVRALNTASRFLHFGHSFFSPSESIPTPDKSSKLNSRGLLFHRTTRRVNLSWPAANWQQGVHAGPDSRVGAHEPMPPRDIAHSGGLVFAVDAALHAWMAATAYPGQPSVVGHEHIGPSRLVPLRSEERR